jgi:hypothetical protein
MANLSLLKQMKKVEDIGQMKIRNMNGELSNLLK